MNKKRVLALTLTIITALALIGYSPKLLTTHAQTPNPATGLTITGLVQNPLSLTLDQIEAMPQNTEYAVLACVDSPTTNLQTGYWTGVQLSYLLQQANVSSSAVKVAFFATDGFTTDLTVSAATQSTNILVAYEENEQPLGGLRLVVPGDWGYKWISDLTQIQLVNYNFLGTEESQGYPDNATITGSYESSTGSSSIYQPDMSPLPSNETTTAQNSTFTPGPSSSLLPTVTKAAVPAALNPKPQQTSLFLVGVFAGAVIIAASTVASAAVLTKRKKAKTLGPALKDSQGTTNRR